MTTIGERLESEWHALRSHLPHPHYDDPDTTPAPEAPVIDLATIEQDVRDRVQSAISHAEQLGGELKAVIDEHLPAIATAAAAAQASPIVKALEDAVLSPEDETMIASLISRFASYAAEHAPAQPEQPADVAMGEPQPVPVPTGPVVAGQA